MSVTGPLLSPVDVPMDLHNIRIIICRAMRVSTTVLRSCVKVEVAVLLLLLTVALMMMMRGFMSTDVGLTY